jgi:hypothetical protein
MIRIDLVKKFPVQNLMAREVKVVEFEDSLVTPQWLDELKPAPKKAWNRELSTALVRDVVTNEIFRVPESQIKWHLRGDNQAILFVNRGNQA